MGALSKIGLIILIIAIVVSYLVYYYVLFPRMILRKLKWEFQKDIKKPTINSEVNNDYSHLLTSLKGMKVNTQLKPDDLGIIQMVDENQFSMINVNLEIANISKGMNMSLIHDSTSLYNFLSKSFSEKRDAEYLHRSKDLIIIKKVPDSGFYLYLKYLPPFARK